MLFSVGLLVPVRYLGRMLRTPTTMSAGLALHLAIPLRRTPTRTAAVA
ncbi:hypothetical protein [Streptomyces olivochromogenes]|nr:hypothetical protein [Streptomyces olivochromogenes]